MSLTVSGAGGQDSVLLQMLQQALAARQADAGTSSGSSTGNNKSSTSTTAAIDLSGASTVSSQLLSVITQIAGTVSSSGDGAAANTTGVGGAHGAHSHGAHKAGGDGDGDADDGVTNALQSATGSDNDTSGASSTSGSVTGAGLQAIVAALQAYAENSGPVSGSTPIG